MSTEQPFFLTQNQGFAAAKPEDDLLHPERNKLIDDMTCTETQYFGFSVPDEQINALGYMWHHPKLGVVTGGLLVWQGIKQFTAAADLCDMRVHMSDDVLKNDLRDFRLVNGYGVRVLEPLKRHRLTYEDASRRHRVDIEYEALLPPILLGDGNHFEQPMRARGELTLRGKRYDIDCYNVRDRSWGKSRPEHNMSVPPLTWATGVFNEGFSFNCCLFDDARDYPALRGRFEMPPDKLVSSGWIHRDGKRGQVVSGRKLVERDLKTFVTPRIQFELTDDLGRTMTIKGELISSCPWAFWPNMVTVLGMMRWTCDGIDGYGDSQCVFWSDYMSYAAL